MNYIQKYICRYCSKQKVFFSVIKIREIVLYKHKNQKNDLTDNMLHGYGINSIASVDLKIKILFLQFEIFFKKNKFINTHTNIFIF